MNTGSHIIFLAFCFVLLPMTAANAQMKAKAGGGLSYGEEIASVGIEAGAVLGFGKIRGAADFKWYFPNAPVGTENNFWELNANVHHLLDANTAATIYGMAGLNYAAQKISSPNAVYFRDEIGLNVGAGGEYGIGFGSLYAEVKYIISDFDQLVLSTGLRFDL